MEKDEIALEESVPIVAHRTLEVFATYRNNDLYDIDMELLESRGK